MTDAASPADAEREIRALIESRVAAVRARDVDGAMAAVSADVLTYDVVGPLRYSGAAAATERAEDWFSTFKGPIGFELRDLEIAVDGDVAFSHSLNRYSGTTTHGTLDMWVRVTTGYRRTGGRWAIVHEHGSVPFSVETGKPSLDLQP